MCIRDRTIDRSKSGEYRRLVTQYETAVAATFGRSNSATLDETIERWVGYLEMIKTALLTIGDSPIANAAIRAVSEHSHLEYIVFSRKNARFRCSVEFENTVFCILCTRWSAGYFFGFQ